MTDAQLQQLQKQNQVVPASILPKPLADLGLDEEDFAWLWAQRPTEGRHKYKMYGREVAVPRDLRLFFRGIFQQSQLKHLNQTNHLN